MSQTTTAGIGAAAMALLIGGSQLITGVAAADPEVPPSAELHNITYRARVDGVSRNVSITYLGDGDQMMSADPTMVPGRVFEASAVLADPAKANMRVAVDWPYSANLHCEILVDDAIVAQADDFVAPRLTRAKDDPEYGALSCGSPTELPPGQAVSTEPVETPPIEPPPPPTG